MAESHFELEVYRKAFEASQRIFTHSKGFPKEETYSLTNQIRRSSRSVCANVAEAWRKRRYRVAFASKVSDAEAEAAETQTWLQYAVECEYLPREVAVEIFREYDQILRMLVAMISRADDWCRPLKKG